MMERQHDIGQLGESMVQFVVMGQPVAKGRPRFVRRGKHVGTYTPEKTATYEAQVRLVATRAMLGKSSSSKPIELSVLLFLAIPSSWSKKRQELAMQGRIRPTKKPDADNVIKLISDGCNGIVWRDDAQIVSLRVCKKYSPQPHASVHVRELDGESA